jgi:hypothetical protein
MAFPAATAFKGNSGANATSSSVLHGGSAGQRVVVLFEKDGTAAPTGGTTGWTLLASGTQGGAMWAGVYTRDLDGGANDTLTITHASEGTAWAGFRVPAGDYKANEAVAISTGVAGTGSSVNSDILDPANWGTEDTLWGWLAGWDGNISLTVYPANMANDRDTDRWANTGGGGAAVATADSATVNFDPGAATLSGASSFRTWTVAIRPALKITAGGGLTPAGNEAHTAARVMAPVARIMLHQVDDDMGRTVVDGMGSPDIGPGAYTASGTAADYDVGSGKATISVVANGLHFAQVPVAVGDVDLLIATSVDAIPTGGAVFSYLQARAQGTTDLYWTQLEWRTTGGIRGGINRRIGNTGSGGTLVALDGVAFGSPTFVANDLYWMRMQVTGASPTTIRLKIWKDGTAEPALWQQEVQDSTSPLQGTGAVGFGNQAASGLTGTRVTSHDQFRARQVMGTLALVHNVGGGPTPLAVAGAITPTGNEFHTLARVIAPVGAITPAGAEAHTVARRLFPVGSIASGAVLAKRLNRSLVASITPAAVLARRWARAFAGTVAPTGALAAAKVAIRAYAGSVASTGLLARRTATAKGGSVATVGTEAMRWSRTLTASIASSGALANVRAVLRAFSGTIASSGTEAMRLVRSLGGSVASTGAAVRRLARATSGTVASGGSLATIRAVLRSMAGSVGSSGLLRRSTGLVRGGTALTAGTVRRMVARRVAGTVGPSGVLATLRAVVRAFAGAVTSGASLRRQARKALGGAVQPAGTVTMPQAVQVALAGSVAAVGAVARRLARSLAGTVGSSSDAVLVLHSVNDARFRYGTSAALAVAAGPRALVTVRDPAAGVALVGGPSGSVTVRGASGSVGVRAASSARLGDDE